MIRSGEARLVGWSRQMLYSGFNILPRSVFWSADFNGRSDNLDVIRLKFPIVRIMIRYNIKTLLLFTAVASVSLAITYNWLCWKTNKKTDLAVNAAASIANYEVADRFDIQIFTGESLPLSSFSAVEDELVEKRSVFLIGWSRITRHLVVPDRIDVFVESRCDWPFGNPSVKIYGLQTSDNKWFIELLSDILGNAGVTVDEISAVPVG